MRLIIMDTNFILIPFMFHVDIFSELQRICDFPYKICLLDRSFEELKRIATKEKKFIKPALALIEKEGSEIIKTEGRKSVDLLLVEVAKEKKAIVATQDQQLRKNLKREKIPFIYMRQKKYLEIQKNVL